MDKFTLELPAMFGDHHVVEVRRLIFELPGVEEVYASSGFRAVEITFDPEKVSEETLTTKLEEAGYLGELPIPVETGAPLYGTNGKGVFYRHTAAYEQTKDVIGFGQEVSYEGRPLWPCPGMKPISTMAEKD